MNQSLKISQSVNNSMRNSIIISQETLTPQQKLRKENLQKYQIQRHQKQVGFFSKMWNKIKPDYEIQFLYHCANNQVQKAYKMIKKLKLEQNQQIPYLCLVQSINQRKKHINKLQNEVSFMKKECQKIKKSIEFTTMTFKANNNKQQYTAKMFQSFIQNLSASHYDVAEIYIKDIPLQSQQNCRQLLSQTYAFDHVQRMIQGDDFYLNPQQKFLNQQGLQLITSVKQLSNPHKKVIKYFENCISEMKDIQWNKPQQQFKKKIELLSQQSKEQLRQIRKKIIDLECDKSAFLMFCNNYSNEKTSFQKIQFDSFICSQLTKEALKYLQPILNHYYQPKYQQNIEFIDSNKKQRLPQGNIFKSHKNNSISFFSCNRCQNTNNILTLIIKTLQQNQMLGNNKKIQKLDNLQKIQYVLQPLVNFYINVVQIVKPMHDVDSDNSIQEKIDEVIQKLDHKYNYYQAIGKGFQEKQKIIEKVNQKINGIMKQKKVKQFLKQYKIGFYTKQSEIKQIQCIQDQYMNTINETTIETIHKYFQKVIHSLINCLKEYFLLHNELNKTNQQLKQLIEIKPNNKQIQQKNNKLFQEYKKIQQIVINEVKQLKLDMNNDQSITEYLNRIINYHSQQKQTNDKFKQSLKKIITQNSQQKLINLSSQQQLIVKIKAIFESFQTTKSENINLISKIQNLQVNINQLQNVKQQNQNHLNIKEQFQLNIKELTTKIQIFTKQKHRNNEMQQEIHELKLQYQTQKTQLQLNVKELTTKNIQITKKHKDRNNEIQQEINQLKLQYQTQKTQLQLNVKELTTKNIQITKKHKDRNNEMQQEINQLTNKVEKLTKNISQIELQNNQLAKNINDLQKNRKNLQAQNSNLQQKIKNIQTQLRINIQRNIDKFFVGTVLDNQDQNKKFLINQIQLLMKSHIKKTTLLYRMDKLNKVNFHEYLDKKRNFIVIIRTKNNKLLGGFSEGALIQNQYSRQRACIFSLTNKKVFKINTKNPSYKSINYDSFYVIFGNSELRLKALDDKVFSNFNIVNNYYEAEGESVDILLGEGKESRQVKIDTYQFYQIEFAN